MSHMVRKNPSVPDLAAPLNDEGSVIRPRNATDSSRPGQASSPELETDPAPHTQRSRPSARPARGSLDDRLEKKMLLAGDLLRQLPSSDGRVRLIYAAVMRRDETLLDAILAELNKPRSGG